MKVPMAKITSVLDIDDETKRLNALETPSSTDVRFAVSELPHSNSAAALVGGEKSTQPTNIRCTHCGQEFREDDSRVEFEDGWMHYYDCSDREVPKPSKFIKRVIGAFIPSRLAEGRR